MTTSSNAVVFQNVSKVYKTYSTPRDRLMELLSGGRRVRSNETAALRNVSFVLPKGGRLGIVGSNGSGKSTLLKVLAGVLTPTAGTVETSGRISALLELGAGFNGELTGVENIRQYCLLHGMSREEIEIALPKIVAFSELREAVKHPVKTYSSGMAVRLGFSCAVYVKPDILIVDEALSVGDAYFQNKCLQKIKALLDDGTSFIYVTHAADSVRALCTTGLWMDHGLVRMEGSSSEVGAAYQADVFRRMIHSGIEPQPVDENLPTIVDATLASSEVKYNDNRHRLFEQRVSDLRSGSGEAQIVDISIINREGAETDTVSFKERLRVRIFYRVFEKLPPDCGLTLGITDSSGRQLLHFNSLTSDVVLKSRTSSPLDVIEFEFDNLLAPGEYGVIAGIGTFKRNPKQFGQLLTDEIVDYVAGGARFSVEFPSQDVKLDLWGVWCPQCSISQFSVG
ncbi:ABC transporter ATP-binding protein [Brucella pseudogrignonensis]|uniref:ABC transporter ATP-binding protein n=1 Tax=Brucella pseudogrignonensis TaxID=419475 RepID=A0A256G437_9HYPH|nr:ABC transporter ATP-binding protein [Brucella pseudogrignonensis]NNV18873.1 ABC transporter ATP-binding protein [Brucella pseudogrignonensis]OYR21865.1 ABC transporter family protein [Brucella pseudogrignonensis]